MTGLLRMRKVASGLLLVGVLMMMTTVATTAASSGHSKAKFSASAPVFAVGPGEGASTTIKVVRRGPAGPIKKIKIHTVNEAVAAAPLMRDPGCKDNDGGDACDATAELLNGAAVYSLHISDSVLKKVDVGVIPAGTPLPDDPLPYDVETYSGKISGKLKGQFTVAQNPAAVPPHSATVSLILGNSASSICPDLKMSVSHCLSFSPAVAMA